ncbi:AP-5 complex subunit beta-1-like [Oscarella lobularis]|uniref:AP-5 complex subunit beta-1-like n=1 Tax=Oscarella lobularis TaxID=121494 RepID=UPI003313AE2C
MDLFQDNWVKEIAEFRRSPQTFFAAENTSAGDFVHYILLALTSENKKESTKVNVLGLFQEYPSILLTDTITVEHTFGSLKDIYDQLEKEKLFFFRSQILFTLTVLVVEFEFMENQLLLFKDVLAKTIATTNSPDRIVRAAACQCLLELEITYPGLLQNRLASLYAMAQDELTSVHQDYLLLFVTVLRHVLLNLTQDKEKHADNKLNDMLLMQTDLRTAISPTSPTYETETAISMKLTERKLPFAIDTRELRKAVSWVMDSASLMTPHCLTSVVYQLADCVKISGLSPTTFKQQILRHIASLSLPLFHLVFLLKIKFDRELFEKCDEDRLLKRLICNAQHPGLPLGHRLLCYNWLLQFPSQSRDGEPSIPHHLSRNQYRSFFPSIFDDLDIISRKLDILSLCYKPSSVSDSASFALMGSLTILDKAIQFGYVGGYAVTLFRSLYIFYKRHNQSALSKEIFKFILTSVLCRPKLAAHTVDFLRCVSRLTPQSPLVLDMLRSLCEQTVSAPLSSVLDNLTHNLLILQRSAREVQIRPTDTARFLYHLLASSELCVDGDWNIGNSVLLVCRGLLQTHHTTTICTELGDLLLLIAEKFSDIDIRDRARFYYTMLTSMSSEKLHRVLSLSPETGTEALSTLIQDDFSAPSYPPAPPLKSISTPLLQLERVTKPKIDFRNLRDWTVTKKDSSRIQGLLERYGSLLESPTFRPVVKISYVLHYSPSVSSTPDLPQEVFAVELHLSESPHYEPVSDALVPYLSHLSDTKASQSDVRLDFVPKQPLPTDFDVTATFTDVAGHTFSCRLAPLYLAFENLFLPLSLPDDFMTHEAKACALKQIFEELWTQIHSSKNGGGVESVQSLRGKKEEIEESLYRCLGEFIIDVQGGLFSIAIFLPPKYHLLMKVQLENDLTRVALATDNWQVLAHVSEYLQSLGKGFA